MPWALAIGIDYKLFWHLNPKKLKPFWEADKIRIQSRMAANETVSYMNGLYVAKAISACFSKGNKYPDKPIGIFSFNEKTQKEMTEEEKKEARLSLFESLKLMQINFEKNKNQERVP